MIDWKEVYTYTLKNICEKDRDMFSNIIEQDMPNFQDKLIQNENADRNALFSYKLNDTATEDDYKEFCVYVYNYIGEDIYDYLKENNFDENEEEDFNLGE